MEEDSDGYTDSEVMENRPLLNVDINVNLYNLNEKVNQNVQREGLPKKTHLHDLSFNWNVNYAQRSQ